MTTHFSDANIKRIFVTNGEDCFLEKLLVCGRPVEFDFRDAFLQMVCPEVYWWMMERWDIQSLKGMTMPFVKQQLWTIFNVEKWTNEYLLYLLRIHFVSIGVFADST